MRPKFNADAKTHSSVEKYSKKTPEAKDLTENQKFCVNRLGVICMALSFPRFRPPIDNG